MSVFAVNPHILHWDHYQRDCRQPGPANSGGASFVLWVKGGGHFAASGARRKASKGRGELAKVEAFLQDSSRPTSIDMKPIASVEELDLILSQAKELSEIVIIDWMAAWCRKCIYLKPKLEKLAAEFHPRIKFYFVDVNKVPQNLVKRGNISKMPTIQLWKDGERKAEIIGGHKAWLVMDEVREMIQKYK